MWAINCPSETCNRLAEVCSVSLSKRHTATAIDECMPDRSSTHVVFFFLINHPFLDTPIFGTPHVCTILCNGKVEPRACECQNVSQIPCLWPGGWCLLSLPCKSHRGYRGSSQNDFQSRNQWFYDLLCLVSFSIFSKFDFGADCVQNMLMMLFTFAKNTFKDVLRQVISWITTATLQHPGFQQRPCCTVPKSTDEKLDPF